MFGLRKAPSANELLLSNLLDQDSFYSAFEKDLLRANREVITEGLLLL